MESRAGTADLAGQHAQRNEAACVVGAVHVLRDAHAPQDHRGLRCCEQPRHFANRFRRDAADRRHRFGTVFRDVILNFVVSARAIGNERLRRETFVDDRVHHRVQERNVGVRLELQHVRCVSRELGATWIGDHQLGAVLDRVLDPRCRDRMIDDGVRADQQNDVGLEHVHHRIRYRARSDAFQQRCNTGCVAKPRAVIDVVRAKSRAHQFLK